MTQTKHVLPPPHDPAPEWGQSLSTGAAGIALLHLENAHAVTGSWDTAHQWVRAMTRAPVTAHPEASSLYRGALRSTIATSYVLARQCRLPLHPRHLGVGYRSAPTFRDALARRRGGGRSGGGVLRGAG